MKRFAAVCEEVARQPSRLRKLATVADYLRALDPDDLQRAVRFFCGQPLPHSDRRGLAVGGSTLREAVLGVTGLDAEVVRLANREVGDTAETIALLMRNRPGTEAPLLAESEAIFADLHRSRKTAEKLRIVQECLQRFEPPVLKYFLKIMTGNLRIGVQERLIEEALAQSCGVDAAMVRNAANRSGDLTAVARALRAGTLERVEARLFHPLDFMLAKPLDNTADLPSGCTWFVEDKYDGIRCQAHVRAGAAKLFSRGGEDVTNSYPELVLALTSLPRAAILDGELLAWREDRALPFNLLQQRLARKRVTQQLMEEIPVSFIAYDLLFEDRELLLDLPIEERRARLERLLGPSRGRLMLSPQRRLEDHAIDALFEDARRRGNEGLVLKRAASVYEGGRRGGNWLKVKRPYATLDVVVTAAEQGRGRRATMLSDYTFAVRAGERFLNVGKAYSGLTDEEIRQLTRLLRSLASERYGRVLLVRPEVVLEVACDGIQQSPRHKSGFAMRFPRILRWRKDKSASEADTIERVRQLYEASLARTGP